MLQSFLTEPCRIDFSESEVPVPGEGEVLIRMKLAGICGSDVHLFRNGPQTSGPLTIGHEGIGIIKGAGSGVAQNRLGETVVIEPNIPCGKCPDCWKGRGNICRNKRIIGVSEPGCFAEYLCIPGDFAHTLPPSVRDQDGVAIEPAAVALAALNRSTARPGDSIAVIGLGALGLLVTHIALETGYRVVVSEPVKSKLDRAVDMGAIPVPAENTLEKSIRSLEKALEREEVVVVFECAGSENSATMSIEAAPRGADVILLGLTESNNHFRSRSISRKGNRIIPSLIYDHPFDFKRCISLVERGIIHPGAVVSRMFDFKDLQNALEEAATGQEGKLVIRMPSFPEV